MRFETIPQGVTRQLDGPWTGIKVLSANAALGSAVAVDRLALPMSILPSFSGRIQVVVATGPVVFAVTENEDERLSDIDASAAPPQGTLLIQEDVWNMPAVGDPGYVAPGWGWIRWFARPSWARSVWLTMLGTGAGFPAYQGCTGYTVNGARKYNDGSMVADGTALALGAMALSPGENGLEQLSLPKLPDAVGIYGVASGIVGNTGIAPGPNGVKFICRWSN